ncbi:MAG: DHHA1 domain-containing protein [Anaerosomatales bacterium]|nr:DHHA1 domain-containing protein [Anaerosomatales bacterium]
MRSEADALHAAAHAALAARHVVVCSHVDPDGDAVGSVLALVHALEAAGVRADAVLASGDHAPVTYAFLPGAERFVRAAEVDRRPDCVFALDAPNPVRLGEAAAFLKGSSTVVIDHHPDNERFGQVSVVDPDAPSTSALIWELLPALGVAPSQAVLDCVFCGLMTDTGRFSFDNATPRAFRLAAELAEAGARTTWVYRNVYERRSHAALLLVSRAMDRLTFANGGAVAYSWISDDDLRETGALPEETEDLIDAIRVVAGPQVVVLFKSAPGRVKGSVRAKDETDVGAVARALGGGGHRAAAGFTIDGSLDDALDAVLPLLPTRS